MHTMQHACHVVNGQLPAPPPCWKGLAEWVYACGQGWWVLRSSSWAALLEQRLAESLPGRGSIQDA